MALTDNFDSYSNSDLNGQGGWSGDTDFDVQDTVVIQGTKTVAATGDGARADCKKSFTAESTGKQVFYIRSTDASKDCGGIQLGKTATAVISIIISAGYLKYYDGSAYQPIQAVSSNTTYKVEVEWDCSTNQARYRVDDGAWTSWDSYIGTPSDIDYFDLYVRADTGFTLYWDDLRPGGTLYTLTLTESLTLTDSLIKKATKLCSETLTIADTFLKSLSRQFSETLILTDTVEKIKIYLKELTESVSLTDVFRGIANKVLQETISLTDSISKLQNKVISETITLADSIIKKIHKTFTETLTLTDVVKLLKNGLSVLWSKVPRPLSGGWTKQSRQTDNTWHKQARP